MESVTQDLLADLDSREEYLAGLLDDYPLMLAERSKGIEKYIDESRRRAREVGPAREIRFLDLANAIAGRVIAERPIVARSLLR